MRGGWWGGVGRLAVALVQQLRDVKNVSTVFLAFSYWSQDNAVEADIRPAFRKSGRGEKKEMEAIHS